MRTPSRHRRAVADDGPSADAADSRQNPPRRPVMREQTEAKHYRSTKLSLSDNLCWPMMQRTSFPTPSSATECIVYTRSNLSLN